MSMALCTKGFCKRSSKTRN